MPKDERQVACSAYPHRISDDGHSEGAILLHLALRRLWSAGAAQDNLGPNLAGGAGESRATLRRSADRGARFAAGIDVGTRQSHGRAAGRLREWKTEGLQEVHGCEPWRFSGDLWLSHYRQLHTTE